MKAEGKTLQEIADAVGVKNRSLIGEWINGNREAANAPFSNLMSYLENLGFDYRDFFPSTEKGTRTSDGGDEEAVIRHASPHAPLKEAGTNEELARLRAQLEAEREKTALLKELLTTALSAGRGAAAEPPAAPDQLKRKAG